MERRSDGVWMGLSSVLESYSLVSGHPMTGPLEPTRLRLDDRRFPSSHSRGLLLCPQPDGVRGVYFNVVGSCIHVLRFLLRLLLFCGYIIVSSLSHFSVLKIDMACYDPDNADSRACLPQIHSPVILHSIQERTTKLTMFVALACFLR